MKNEGLDDLAKMILAKRSNAGSFLDSLEQKYCGGGTGKGKKKANPHDMLDDETFNQIQKDMMKKKKPTNAGKKIKK